MTSACSASLFPPQHEVKTYWPSRSGVRQRHLSWSRDLDELRVAIWPVSESTPGEDDDEQRTDCVGDAEIPPSIEDSHPEASVNPPEGDWISNELIKHQHSGGIHRRVQEDRDENTSLCVVEDQRHENPGWYCKENQESY